MVVIACLMAFFAIFDVVVVFLVNLKAISRIQNKQGSPNDVFDDTAGWLNVMGTVNVIAQTILGDGMLIYRCWAVYGRAWVVIAAPLVIAIAGIVCVVLSIYYEVVLPSGSQFASPYRELVISTWAITIALNILTTSLIIFRIWRVAGKGLKTLTGDDQKYDRVIRTIVESGLMYTITACMTAIAYISGSKAFGPLSSMDIDIIGIAFNLIIIRVYSRREEAANSHRAQRSSTLIFSPAPHGSTIDGRPTDSLLDGVVPTSRPQTTIYSYIPSLIPTWKGTT